MRRIAAALTAVVTAFVVAACGGGSTTPTPTPGGGTTGGVVVTPNTPPVIKSITVSDPRVEAGVPVTLTALVEDAETPVANLTYGWTLPGPSGIQIGVGNGGAVTWTPGTDLKTPGDYEIGLTVTERYTTGGVQAENKTTGSVTVHVNNSPKELAELSLRFLGDFVNSKISPDKCVAEFSDSCSGKKSEFDDIDDNRHDYEIIASTLRHTSLTVASSRVTATVHTFCSFTSKVITTEPRDEPCQNGKCPLGSIQGPVTGDCFTTNVYQGGRWWLCESHFGPVNGIWTEFARAFFHMDRRELR